MSLTDIMAPMDGDVWVDATVDLPTRREIEQRLSEIKGDEVKWSTWSDSKERVVAKLRVMTG